MKDLKKNILELYGNGLKPKEISEKLHVEYLVVTKIVENNQRKIRRAKNLEPYDKSAKANYYQRNVEKLKAKSNKRYSEKKDEISARTKEDRKKNPEKYRLKRQKEKAKDPERFKAKKNANWAKNYPKNKVRLSKKTRIVRVEKKQLVFTHYSKKLSNSNVPCCNCCGYTGIEFLTIDHIIPKREMEKKFKSIVKTINENISITPNEIKAGYNAKRKAHQLIQWLITNNFPKKFQILCWNCNFAKGILGKCPHQK